MLAPMIGIEHTKLYRRRVLWVEMALVALLVVAMFGMIAVMHLTGLLGSEGDQLQEIVTWPGSLLLSLNISASSGLGGLLVVVLVGVVVAQEYQWQTYSLWLRQGVGRPAVLVAKIVTLLGAILLLVLTPLLVGGLASAAVTPLITGTLRVEDVVFGEVLLSVLRTAYSLLPFMALTCLIAVRTRSMAASIGIGVGYTLLVEEVFAQIMMLVGGVPARLAMYLPGQMAAALSNMNSEIMAFTATVTQGGEEMLAMMPQYVPLEVAVVGVAIYTLLFLGLAARMFLKQDLTA
ncbi:MAG: ABC transporter permease subunit [Chloroflexi bacterium]|nr:ABC transporter permease subunit [Chloroflexota bacterium]